MNIKSLAYEYTSRAVTHDATIERHWDSVIKQMNAALLALLAQCVEVCEHRVKVYDQTDSSTAFYAKREAEVIAEALRQFASEDAPLILSIEDRAQQMLEIHNAWARDNKAGNEDLKHEFVEMLRRFGGDLAEMARRQKEEWQRSILPDSRAQYTTIAKQAIETAGRIEQDIRELIEEKGSKT